MIKAANQITSQEGRYRMHFDINHGIQLNSIFDNPSKLLDIFRNMLVFNLLSQQISNATGSPSPIQNF